MEPYIRLTNIIGVIKLKEMIYAGHIARMYTARNGCYNLFKDLKEEGYVPGNLKIQAWIGEEY